LAGVALAALAVRVAHRPHRRLELAAHLRSIELVGLDDVAATLRHLRGREQAIDRLVAAAGFTARPTAAQRLRHLSAAVGRFCR